MARVQFGLFVGFSMLGTSVVLAAEATVSIHNMSPMKIYGLAYAPVGTTDWADDQSMGGEGDIVEVGASRDLVPPDGGHYDVKVSASTLAAPKLSDCIIKNVDFSKQHTINFVGKKCVLEK